MKYAIRTEADKKVLVTKILAAKKKGTTTAAACKAEGISESQFYMWRKGKFLGTRGAHTKKRKRQKRSPEVLHIPAMPMSQQSSYEPRIFVVSCPVTAIRSVLEQMS